MKRINKIALLLILIASVFCFTSCKIYKFNIIEDEINIYVGEDKYLKCDYDIFTLEDVTKDSSEIEWTISDESVCRMRGNFVYGLSEGTAIVTGNYHGVIDSVRVNVTYEQVKSLELRPDINMFYFYYSNNEYKNQLVCVGDLFTVDADIVLTFEHKVDWEVSNSTISFVEAKDTYQNHSYATFRAEKVGTSQIIVTSGTITKTLDVEVIPANSAKIVSTTDLFEKGMEYNLSASFPALENVNETFIRWASSNDDIVDVDGKTGKIKCKATGSAVIYCHINGYTLEKTINVSYVPIERVDLNMESVYIGTGLYYEFTPTVYPLNATNREITHFKSLDTSIASVYGTSNGGLEIYGKAKGTTTIEIYFGDHVERQEIHIFDRNGLAVKRIENTIKLNSDGTITEDFYITNNTGFTMYYADFNLTGKRVTTQLTYFYYYSVVINNTFENGIKNGETHRMTVEFKQYSSKEDSDYYLSNNYVQYVCTYYSNYYNYWYPAYIDEKTNKLKTDIDYNTIEVNLLYALFE